MNTWMNNPQYLAQIGHTLGGALIVILACVFFGFAAWRPAALAILFAGLIKEFWYDMRYELPRQTWADSAMDLAFYIVGGALGTLIMLEAHRLGRV